MMMTRREPPSLLILNLLRLHVADAAPAVWKYTRIGDIEVSELFFLLYYFYVILLLREREVKHNLYLL